MSIEAMNAIEQLKSVLCDPEGKCCIVGSEEDRAIVDRALQALSAPVQEPVAVHQYRVPHCSDWYDGIPDHHDGHGPYEVRVLYTTPAGGRQSEDCLTAAPVQEKSK